jgi:methanogenic corrinoid protein MtbC1
MTTSEPSASARLPRHPVRVVSQRTGLSAHALRAWERRYSIVSPVRTEGGQRLYSDADIDRLLFLKALTDSGYSIGQLAALPAEELGRLYKEEAVPAAAEALGERGENGAGAARAAVLQAIEDFDAVLLRHELESATVALGVSRFLEHVLAPVLTEIGDRWQNGQTSIAHEHLASAVVRQVLGWIRETAETPGPAPTLVVATPAGQVHEGGALMVAAAASVEGWQVAYLGTNLPALDIAEAARRTGARAVALSLLYPTDDPALGKELRALREALPRRVALMVGGAAAPAYAAAIKAAEGAIALDLPAARAMLRGLAEGQRQS